MVESYDILDKLPIEIAQNILMRIPSDDLCNVSKCCKRWKNIIRGTYFWKNKSEQDYNFARSEYVESECYRKYVQNFSNHWQGHYTYNCELEYNWKNGICKKISVENILNIHRFVYMDDDILIVTKTDEICIIRILNGLIENTFHVEHLTKVVVEKNEGLLIALCFTTEENHISSQIVKVWDLKTKEAMVNFEHNLFLSFSQVLVYKHLIAFIDRDELYIFNIKRIFDYKRRQIHSMCFGSEKIAFLIGFNLIEIVDLKFNVLMELTCCDDKFINNIEMKNNHLFVESMRNNEVDGMNRLIQFICVWDLTTKTKVCTIEDGQLVDLTFINENKLICLTPNLTGYWLECVSLPLLVTQTIIGRKTCEYYTYTSNNRFLFAGIRETSSLNMWCPRTQKLIRSFDLKEFNTRFSNCNFGHIDFVMVSNKNLAYVEKVYGKDIVHIMDFGPDIENKLTFI